MRCQSIFSGKNNKKIISLSSAESPENGKGSRAVRSRKIPMYLFRRLVVACKGSNVMFSVEKNKTKHYCVLREDRALKESQTRQAFPFKRKVYFFCPIYVFVNMKELN